MAVCENLDLYCILVENVFGSIILSILSMAIVLVLIFMVGRVSPFVWIPYTAIFLFVGLTYYFGTALSFIILIMSLIYFGWGVRKYLTDRG